MPQWPEPRSISVGFAFGTSQFDDPTAVTYEIVSPADDPDTGDDPGPILDGFTIARGRVGDAPETQPTSIAVSLRNENGEFSPRNVSGPRYGTLRRGAWTQIAIDCLPPVTPAEVTAAVGSTANNASSTSNSTSFSVTMPSGIVAGNLLVAFVSSASNATLSATGWTKLGQASNGTTVSGAVFYKTAAGSDTLTVTSATTTQYSAIVYRITGSALTVVGASANGSSTNSNPPNEATGVSHAYLWIASRSGAGTTVATVAPSGFSSLISRAGGGASGASTNTAVQALTAASNDPGTFTSGSAAWVSWTVAIAPATPVPVPADPLVLATASAPGFTPTRTGPGINPQVAVSGLGLLNRLGRDTDRRSPVRRYFRATPIEPVAWWPLDDPAGSTAVNSPYSVSGSIPVPGRATFGRKGPDGTSGAVQVVCGDQLVGPYSDNRPALSLPVPSHTPGQLVWSLWFRGSPFAETPGADGSDGSIAVASSWMNFSSGTIRSVVITMTETVPGTNPIQSYVSVTPWTGLDGSGTSLTEINTFPDGPQIFDGGWHQVQVRIAQSGGDVTTALYLDGVLYDGATETTQTLGIASEIKLAASGSVLNADTSADAGATIFDVSTIALHNTTSVTVDELYEAGAGYPTETAAFRMNRVLNEAGISAFDAVSHSGNTTGPQPVGTTLEICRDAELADDGVLYEARDGSLMYQATAARYNAPVAVTLAYTDIVGAYPIDDDRDVYNLITVTKPDGSSSTAERTTGPLSTDPNTGIGPRPIAFQRNPEASPTLLSGHLLGKATTDKPRFIVIIDLTNEPDLAADVLSCDIGSRTVITGGPAEDVGPDDLDLIVEGIQISYEGLRLIVQWDCKPYDPWNVGSYQDDAVLPADRPTRYDASASTTVGSFSAGVDTSLSVATSSGPLWTTTVASMPLRIAVEGVVLNVTAISGASSPQTFTVTATALNGVTKTIPSGSSVRVVDRGLYAM